jgi:putative tryptophan/tyrosine transport system substrate-binding protein
MKEGNRQQARGNSKKIALIPSALGVLLLALSFPAEAQQPAKLPKIGWFFLRPAVDRHGADMAQRALRDLGYIENKNVLFEYRHGDNKIERLPALAEELIRLKVDVIVAASANVAIAARNATKTIPIVFVSTRDPVTAGLVHSLARPGGNLTGFTTIAPILTGKRFELFKETVPVLSRIAVLWNPKNPGSTEDWKESQIAARNLSLQIYSMEVSSGDKFQSKANCGSRGKTSHSGDLPSR